ncbi:MAG: pitrilysin family protein [Terriglobales bacterium]
MKTRLTRILLSIVILLSAAVPRSLAQATEWQQITIPPLPAFHPQEPKRIELPNGMVIFLQEDHELPLIDGVARIRGGSRSEPASKVGMLDIYGEVWRTGGTKTQTGDRLDDYLEIRAAKVETNDTADSTTISWSCLKGDFDDVFKVFNDVLREPEFRTDKIDLAQHEMDDAISRRNDDVSAIASRESKKLAYGASNPYAREPEYATVAAVTRQDLLDWHHAHVYPNNIILGVVGDFDSTVMEAKLRQVFGDWPKGPPLKKVEIDFDPAKPGYYLISKEDVNQSSIDMTELGIRRDNPDYYATQVFNEAFGGGFSSRLFKSIRTAQGLAYGVGGGIGSAFDHPGIVRIAMGTKSATTVESIEALYKEIDNLKPNPISDEEIKRAKDSILNSFVFNFDSPEKVLRERMAYEFYGYPADFLERYRTGIEKVGKEDVARVAAKYLHKDKLAVLVVGNTPDFDKPLSSLGPVTNVDIAIPPPPGQKSEKEEAPAKPSASNPEGKALAAKVAQAMGGIDKLQTIKSLRVNFTESAPGDESPTPIELTLAFPDRMHLSIPTPHGNLAIVVTADSGFMFAEGRGMRDLPAAQKTESLTQIHHDQVYLAQRVNDPAITFTATGTEKVGDIEAAVVDIGGAVPWIRWYVEPKSGRILREDYKGMGQTGEFQGETELSDWRTADGLTLPYLHLNKQNGKDTSTVKYTSIQINPTIDPKLFEKPQQ